jgi:5'-methylthioadenosine phosphorylase
VYAFTAGPRFETGAEISMMQQFAKVVGMTLAPEATLARERGICYGSLCVVSNMAAGMQNKLPAGEIATIYAKMKSMIMQVIDDTISAIPQKASCNCCQAAEQGRL